MGVQLFAGKYFKVRANVFQDNQQKKKIKIKSKIKNPIPKQDTQMKIQSKTKRTNFEKFYKHSHEACAIFRYPKSKQQLISKKSKKKETESSKIHE